MLFIEGSGLSSEVVGAKAATTLAAMAPAAKNTSRMSKRISVTCYEERNQMTAQATELQASPR